LPAVVGVLGKAAANDVIEGARGQRLIVEIGVGSFSRMARARESGFDEGIGDFGAELQGLFRGERAFGDALG